MSTIDTLKQYDELYYNHGKSFVTDEYYDSLKDLLRDKYPGDPYFNDVGSTPINRDKVELPYILGSLNKVRIDTLDKWLSDHRSNSYVMSQKLDGVSILVIYENGYVRKAYTRGDGEYGRDITDKAQIFCPKIENDSIMILRGEAMLIDNVHEKLDFSTARNGTAGILNSDGIENCKYIKPYFYELIRFGDLNTCSEYERFVLIESLGLKTPKWKMVYNVDIESVMSLIALDSDYVTDGVVISINESDRENIKFPKNKIAFKVQGESFRTKVTDIEWNVSRNGRIIPIVIFEPINIKGVNISRATGFNAEFIFESGIEKGCFIDIVRSNDVIPYISSVDDCHVPEPLGRIPDYCPCCGSGLKWCGVDLICENKFGCEAQVLKQLEYFLRTLGAENITTKTLEKMQLYNINDVYELEDVDIIGLEGFGVRSASIIIDEIKGTLNTTQEKLIQAFGISGIGSEMAKSLLKCFGSISAILNASIDDLQECEGIGPKLAENIIKSSNRCNELYKYLISIGMKFKENGGQENKMFDGKKFTLTGKGPMSRDQLKMLIEKFGGTVKGISKDVDYLVTDDLESDSSKMKKAKEYKTTIMTYDDLIDILEGE